MDRNAGTARTALVVGEPGDVAARAVAVALAGLGTGMDVLWWSSGEMRRARWEHRLTPDGRVSTTVRVRTAAGERAVTDADLALVWWRAWVGAPAGLARAAAKDRDYGAAELHALVVAWLAGLGPRVVDAVDGDGLAGPSWSDGRWRAAARDAGLAVADGVLATSGRALAGAGAGTAGGAGWTGTPWQARLPVREPAAVARRVLVAGSVALGARSDDEAAACLRLAHEAGCRLLAVDLDAAGGFVAADAVVQPTTADEVRAVAVALAAHARVGTGVAA